MNAPVASEILDVPDTKHIPRSENIVRLDRTINRYYPNLLSSVHAALAVFGAMALKDRTKPLSLILEGSSGFGKTAVLQMAFPLKDAATGVPVYRSDKFTPKAFVTHAANVKAEDLRNMDLLPKLKGKVLMTKELAPIFRGREEELKENFSTLISVLDGKGFTSDTGMRGQRGYKDNIIFNWIGATTPLPPATHRLMSQLGTRLLFFEVPVTRPTEEELLAYAASDDAGDAEVECQKSVNWFLEEFFRLHPVGSVDPKTIAIPEVLLKQLVRWARFLVTARAEVKSEKAAADWEPIAAMPPEGPFKVINYLKELARGHALVHGRVEVNEGDIALVADVAVSSIPGHLRPIVRELRSAMGRVTSKRCEEVCRVSRPTARRYLKELAVLGVGDLTEGDPARNEPDRLQLSGQFQWLCA
jgi:hypothetical protein